MSTCHGATAWFFSLASAMIQARGLLARRILLYTCGVIPLTMYRAVLHKPGDHFGEPHEIRHPEKRAPSTDDELRVGRNDIGPLPRHRAHAFVVHAEQEPRPVPVVALADADKLLSAQRVEGMGHQHKARACVRRACSSS